MEHHNDTQKEQPHQSKPKTKAKSSRLLGCFGFSRKPYFSDVEKPTTSNVLNVHPDSRKLKKQRWFSRTWFCFNNPDTRTVPLDPTTPDQKPHSNRTSNTSSSKSKSHKKPASSHETPRPTPPRFSSDRATEERPGQTWYGSEQGIILENGEPLDHAETPRDNTSKKRLSFCRKIDAIRSGPNQPGSPIILENGQPLDHMETPKDDTSKKRLSFCRKINAIRTGTNQPGSPEVKPKSTRTVSQLISSPTPAHEQSVAAGAVNMHLVKVKKPRKENDQQVTTKNFDPLVGMSIILVTLMIMLLWGKICAIICTSAWFYFVPRLRNANTVKNRMILGEEDYDSEEYKKTVVLQGLLERNRRPSPS